MRPESEDISGFLDRRKRVATEHFDRHTSGKLRQIEFNHLREAREIHDNENGFVFVAAEKGEYLGVVRKKKFESAAGKGAEIFPGRNHAAHPPEERR